MTEERQNRASLPIARQKLFLAALAFGAGILFAACAPQFRPPLWWMLAALVFTTAALLLRSLPRMQSSLALLAIASLGALGLQLSNHSAAASANSLDGSEVEIVAHVTRDSIARPGFFGSPRQVVELETETVTIDGVTQYLATGIRASLFLRHHAADD